ncbi:hypothetical protein [Acidocella aminolytica]|jgi:hypothetical protein|nr:hypothetical protein [Acidocella aminolytica]
MHGSSVVTGCYPAEVFELIEEHFDAISQLIGFDIVWDLDLSILL